VWHHVLCSITDESAASVFSVSMKIKAADLPTYEIVAKNILATGMH
jgi:hypothetical protein